MRYSLADYKVQRFFGDRYRIVFRAVYNGGNYALYELEKLRS